MPHFHTIHPIALSLLRRAAWTFALICLVLPTFLSNAFAQELRLEHAQQVTAGGRSESGSFTLFSTAGAVSPSGEMSQGEFSTVSGGRLVVEEPPSRLIIIHVPADLAQEQTDIIVSSGVDAANRVRDAQLYYRQGGESGFNEATMTETSDGQYQGTIPGEEVTSRGVAYYILMTDATGRVSRGPSTGVHTVPVHVEEPGLVLDEPLPGGEDQSAYRLVSVPLNLENKDPEAVLTDDFGSYDPDEWRFFELEFDQSVTEYPNTSEMAPGKGFWLIAREGERVFDTGEGLSAPLDEPYGIALHPAWNLVGSPYNFEIPVENARLGRGESFEFRSYREGWNNPINNRLTVLRPFTGYAVFNPASVVDTLYFDPNVSGDQTTTGKIGIAADRQSIDWGIHITAANRSGRDSDNVAAVSDHAAKEWDLLDHPEPPAPGSFISLRFPHPEWGRLSETYSTDVRPVSRDGDLWEFEVESDTDDAVRLSFDGIQEVPTDREVWLVDEFLDQPNNLRSDPTYAFVPAGAHTVRDFQLVVGTRTYIRQTLGEIEAAPRKIELFPIFPNPFSASSTIRFALPEPTHVTVSVFTVLGSLVATLMDSEQSAGVHSLVWDGRGSQGKILPSGSYLLQLQAGSTRFGQTVVIVR